jgi:hypothetical protein
VNLYQTTHPDIRFMGDISRTCDVTLHVLDLTLFS